MLMSNHVHPLLTPDDTDAVSRTLQDLGRRSVPDSNDTDRRSGILGGMRWNAALECGCHQVSDVPHGPVRSRSEAISATGDLTLLTLGCP
jgi:REP element-mobilizing transposase RayT